MSEVVNQIIEPVFDIIEQIRSKHNTINITLALSGGLDSVVLLDVLVQYKLLNKDFNVTAVYINHNLQEDGKDWIKFNQDLCLKYQIDYQYYELIINDFSGLGTEAAAREARYAVFRKLINSPNNYLLTAHHLNDQAETFLLQIMRGSGPKGLSAMPLIKCFSKGQHLRPLLNLSRDSLFQYARDKKLTWVEDKTNLDTKYDRNFIRNKIIPVIEERWPGFVQSAAKSSQYCAEHELVLNDYLSDDLELCLIKNKITLEHKDIVNTKNKNILDLNIFNQYNFVKQKLLLRYWFEQVSQSLYKKSFSLGEKYLKEIINKCINSNSDSKALVIVDNLVVRRYRNYLYLFNKEEYYKFSDTDNCIPNSMNHNYSYNLGTDLNITDLGIRISSKYIANDSLNKYKHEINNSNFKLNIPVDASLNIKFRTHGERCRPVGRGGSVSIKKLFQESHIPPWQRHLIPILYVDNDIASVIGVKNCEPFANASSGWIIECEYY